MSNEIVVNRTPETFGQQLEKERLEAETQAKEQGFVGDLSEAKIPGTVPSAALQTAHTVASIWNPGSTPIWNPGALSTPQTAEAQRAPEVGKIEESPVRDSVAADILFAELVQAAQGRAPRDPDLKEFRRQVIAAFKHSGLDTVKFFGV